MTSDIIIPEYKEPIELRKRLLDSIQAQQGINFNDINVIIINDNSSMYTPRSFLNNYKFKINYLVNDENKGQGYSRQRGIDNTNGDYITFIDSDDYLASIYSLYILTSCANDTHADIIRSAINRGTNEGRFIEAEVHNVNMFLHGKLFRREYLINNNIRFNERLRYCEDSYFTKILFMTSSNHPILNIPIYLWKYNKNSTMRSNDLINKLYDDNFKCINDAYEYIIKKNNNIENKYYLLSGFFELFIKLESQYFDNDKKKDKEKELYDMYLKYKDVFIELNDKLDEIYNDQLELTKRAFNDIVVNMNYKDFIGRDING